MSNPMRLYIRPDNSVVKVELSPKDRRPGESEADWLRRGWARMEATQPGLHEGYRDWATPEELAAILASPVLPCVDVDPSELPARTRLDANGREQSVRIAWRWNGRKVIVDEGQLQAAKRAGLSA